MIVVQCGEDVIDFPDATRFSTDEGNNLCIWTGRDADELVHLFNQAHWQQVEVTDG